MIPKRVALRSRHYVLRTSKDFIGAFRRCCWRKRRGFAPTPSGAAVLLRPFVPAANREHSSRKRGAKQSCPKAVEPLSSPARADIQRRPLFCQQQR